MPTFHEKFPFGKGFWLWELKNCEGGNVDQIIAKCKKYNVSYVMIKAYDGENLYPNRAQSQLTKEMSDKFHANGISIYSWSYNYGYNPKREAELALYCLEQLGVDGHIFNAESEWKALPNPAEAANTMLNIVRSKHPKAFLAHAPFPIIDFHTRFPYIEFGRYCDAVMPQMYWGTIGVSVERMVNWTFEQWSKWEKSWKDSGNGDAVKPIIPIAQGYDNPQTNYIELPAHVKEFITRCSGYGSINFWSWQHFLRADLWEAVRDTGVKPKEQLSSAPVGGQNPTQPQPSTPTPPVTNYPASLEPGRKYGESEIPANLFHISSNDRVSYNNVEYVGIVNNDGTRSFTVYVPPVPTPPAPTPPAAPNPTPPVNVPVPVSNNGKTTVEVTQDEDNPEGVKINIKTHKAHIDYLIEFVRSIFSIFSRGGGSK